MIINNYGLIEIPLDFLSEFHELETNILFSTL